MVHTIESIQDVINKKLRHNVTVKEIKHPKVVLIDDLFGEYTTDIKSFSPKSSIPIHKDRRKLAILDNAKSKYLNKLLKGFLIEDVFYGRDRGYKSKGIFVRYKQVCGHYCEGTPASLKWNKKIGCRDCSIRRTTSGERAKVGDILPKRSVEYNSWVLHKKKLVSQKYKDSFREFLAAIGKKPHHSCIPVEKSNGELIWFEKFLTFEDQDVQKIVQALRQAFRGSKNYNLAILNSAVETDKCTLYRCAMCGELFKRDKVEVDHIDPIRPLSGEPLSKESAMGRIWTDKLQVLDKKCHSLKCKEENRIRNGNREKRQLEVLKGGA